MSHDPLPGPTPTGYQRSQGGTSFKWMPPSPEHLSKLLPQYEIEALIGRGGMGAVYRGKQKALDRIVAIKILPPEVDDEDASYTQRFKNEAKIMARLEHPAIVPVYDFGETSEGQLYFVMSFINGTDVHQMVQSQGRLPPEHALAITAHVCDALAYAHAHGIVHRDIKPSNVLINMEGQVKVADFGLAKVDDPSQSSGLTKTGLAMGTPDYVAPETLTLGMTVDGRADLYAVGVMLYQMLTGRVPRGTFDAPSRIAGTDPRFDSIVFKAMKYDREERYPTATDLRRDLDVILTTPLVQSGGAASAAIPKQALPPKPQARGPAQPQQRPAPPAAPPQAQNHKPKIIMGAAAALAIGAFVMMSGKKDSDISPPTKASTTPAVTTHPEPKPDSRNGGLQPPPSGPSSTTSSKKSTSGAPTGSAPSAPAPAVKNTPLLAGAAKDTFPPGKWVKVFTKFEDLPEALRKPDSGVKWEDGWIKVQGSARKVLTLPFGTHSNCAVRSRILRKNNQGGYAALGVRKSAPPSNQYSLTFFMSRLIVEGLLDGKKQTILDEEHVPPKVGQEYVLEIAVIGSRVIARYGDSVVRIAGDHTLLTGDTFISGSEDLRDIEVINLDGLPEAEALKILGVDEKGNDLRQPAVASSNLKSPISNPAASSPAPSATAPVSSSPSLPISQSSAKFPPGQWVKVFTKLEDLPEDLRKPDSGVKFEDGWLNLGSKQVWLRFPTSLSSNYGIRARFRHRKNAFGSIVLRRQEASKPALYQLRYLDNRLNCQRRDDATYHDIKSIAVRKTLQSQNESTLEFAAVGSRLIGRLDLDAFATGIDATHATGVAHIYGDEDLRDIEVINLDGIPEAEALRILGVDEKGNDLRALAAKQEQQKAEQAKAVDAIAAIPELKVLHEQLVKLQAERVTAPFEKDVAALNTSYLGGLDREIAKERGKGNLDGVIALEAEKKLIADKQPMPAEDDDTTPAALKPLRQVYRAAVAKLATTRAANLKQLTDPLSIRLKQLESTLTQKNRVPDAKVVREYREALGRADGPPSAANALPGANPPKTALAGASALPKKKFPPGDDRKAAEWVLSVGGKVKITNSGATQTISNITELPRGKFDVLDVLLEFNAANRPLAPVDNFLPLAGLKKLSYLKHSGIPISADHLSIVSSLSSLKSYWSERSGLTDAIFSHLSGSNVQMLRLDNEPEIAGPGWAALQGVTNLQHLGLQGSVITEEIIRQIGGLAELNELNLSYTILADEQLHLLQSLRKLTVLLARRTRVTPEAISTMTDWRELRNLQMDVKPDEMAANALLLAKAFPKIESFGFEGTDTLVYSGGDLRGLKAMTKLHSLSIWSTGCADDAATGILDIKSLQMLRLNRCNKVTDSTMAVFSRHKTLIHLLLEELQITDTSLTHLAKLRSLKTLELKTCPNLTDATIAAFQKERPDVTVVR